MSGKKSEVVIGQKFGRWTVIERAFPPGKIRTWVLCRCDCGSIRTIEIGQLNHSKTRSCGCSIGEVQRNRLTRHGKTKHGEKAQRIYRIWSNMRSRCQRQNNKDFSRYGGRGISVCEEWKDFRNFYRDMGDPPTDLHTLDRVNNDGNYEPKNCRWASQKEQKKNTSRTVFIEFNGKRQCLTDWAGEVGLPREMIFRRLTRFGWSVEKSLTTPPDESKRHFKKFARVL